MGNQKEKSKLHASYNILRVGKRYRLQNFGDKYEFEVLEILSNDDCMVRSLDTLETYQLSDLTKFGRGVDFDFEEIYL